jgi:hypothetical protein
MLPKNWSKWSNDKKFVLDDTKKGSITSWFGWKVILGGHATRIHKQQVLLPQGKLQTRVVGAVSR